MNVIAKVLTLIAMLATVAWFFWNPAGWVFEWEPVVVFLFALAGYLSSEFKGSATKDHNVSEDVHPNDVLLFRHFLEVLPSATFIEFLKQHDFLLEFERESILPLRRFINEWDNAEHEFQNEILESLKYELLKVANDFSYKIAKYTSSNQSGFQAVRVDRLKGEEEHEERFRREAGIIDAASDEFVRVHQELVRKGRQLCNLSEPSI